MGQVVGVGGDVSQVDPHRGAVLYAGDPPQLGGSLFTIFSFLMFHLLQKPYLNQGLNVFQRLALISQFCTVFGSLIFVVQEAVAQNTGTEDDSNGKLFVSFLFMMVNAAAGGLYPLYRFLSAFAEHGEIDSALSNAPSPPSLPPSTPHSPMLSPRAFVSKWHASGNGPRCNKDRIFSV